MSGGHYDYSYSNAEGVAEEIEKDLNNPDYAQTLADPRVRQRFELLRDLGYMFARLGREADLLMSCDTGDETFIERFDEILDFSLLRIDRAALGERSESNVILLDEFVRKVRAGEITSGHGFWGFPGGTYTETMIRPSKYLRIPPQATYVEWYE